MNDEPEVVFDDDNPEWTEEDFARARPASEMFGPEILDNLIRGRGRPIKPVAIGKEAVTIPLSPDVHDALLALGPDWEDRADEMLREGLRRAVEKAA